MMQQSPKQALLIGYGISGKACGALLRMHGWDVAAVDRHAKSMTADLPLFPEDAPLPFDSVDLVVLSPGVAPNHPLTRLGREVIGEMELAFRFLHNRCVGVTGTNGKTTTTLLTAHVLNACGIKAKAVGNVGTALSEYLLAPDPSETLVIELSSFQLETLQQRKLSAAVFLNLTPDHLDRYETLRDYAAAKARIQACLTPGAKLFVSSQVLAEYGDLLEPNTTRVFETAVAPISHSRYTQWGKPELQNVEAARALCQELGVSTTAFEAALATFCKPAHRIEWIGEKDGVQYVDDSKGTNVDAVLHAMRLFKGPLVLIVGGVDKGSSYRPWIEPFQEKVRKMIAYGQAAEKMEAELKSAFPFERYELFGDAVAAAKRNAERGDTVLLSPGCSSFDQHRNYAHRGDQFKEIIFDESEKHNLTRSPH